MNITATLGEIILKVAFLFPLVLPLHVFFLPLLGLVASASPSMGWLRRVGMSACRRGPWGRKAALADHYAAAGRISDRSGKRAFRSALPPFMPEIVFLLSFQNSQRFQPCYFMADSRLMHHLHHRGYLLVCLGSFLAKGFRAGGHYLDSPGR